MTSEVDLQYDPNAPRTEHAGMAAAMFGEDFLAGKQDVLNVAGGRTDLAGDMRAIDPTVAVVAVDPIYGSSEYAGKPGRVEGVAQALPFEDESFDVTLCQFGAQHMAPIEVGEAIREMVRVTRPAKGGGDDSKGMIIINPVFRPGRLQKRLIAAGLNNDVAGVINHNAKLVVPKDRKAVHPSLLIYRTEQTTSDQIEALVSAVTETKALKPLVRSLGELASRIAGGRSYV